MKLDAWIVMKKSALETLWQDAHPAPVKPPTQIPADAMLLASAAVRGFWKDITDSGTVYEVVNVIKSPDEIEAFKAAHPGDILAVYGWTQGNGFDNLDAQDAESNVIGYPTIPQGVLDVMKDHVTYDENGDVISTTPPTFDTPNWGHVFVGQADRIFAGEFSNEFTGDYL